MWRYEYVLALYTMFGEGKVWDALAWYVADDVHLSQCNEPFVYLFYRHAGGNGDIVLVDIDEFLEYTGIPAQEIVE